MDSAALTSLSLPLVLATSAITFLWTVRLPKIALGLLGVALMAGQLLRLPLPGQGGGLLASDIASVLVILAAIVVWLRTQRGRNLELGIWNFSIFFLILWSLFTLVIHIPELGVNNTTIAALYWLRLTATLALFPALLALFRKKSVRTFASQGLLAVTAALVIAGLAQILFFPNLELPGWDPHQGRLFSTWLDPNLFGGFLAVALPWVGALIVQRVKEKMDLLAPALIFLGSLLALLLTESRSSWVALLFTSVLVAPLAIWQLAKVSPMKRLGLVLSAGLGLIVVVSAVIFFMPSRLLGLVTIDDTASSRLESLTTAWHVIERNPWAGVGFNAYQFVSEDGRGNFTIHSRAGADNSLLTWWATTGLVGIVSALAAGSLVLGFLLRRALAGDVLSLGAAGSLIALFIHSQLVNSFLYSHLLITLGVILALTMSNAQTPRPNE